MRLTRRGLLFTGEPDARGERGLMEGDMPLPQILQRARRGAGFPAAALPRPPEILGHANGRMTLAIYTHSMRRTRDDPADKIAQLAGLSNVGNQIETTGSVKDEEVEVSDCFHGSPG